MRKIFLKAFTALVALILLTGAVPMTAAADSQSIFDSIVDYKLSSSGAADIRQWINGELTSSAGVTSEWYIMALSQSGEYDFSSYESSLLDYLSKNKVYSASSRQKYALALVACGSTDSYIHNTLNDSIGGQGIMSWVYGLHLLTNGYKSDSHSHSEIKQKILSLQLSDGGWAISGKVGDPDVTAMTVQALAPYYKEQAVGSAVDNALKMLSEKQQSDGDFKSYGQSNPESTAQVLVALSSLGIDYRDDSRFIKDGNTLLDGIKKYQLKDGSFCHKAGGEYNENATAQVFYSMVALSRFEDGKGDFYLLDRRNPSGLKIPATTQKQTTPAPTTAPETDAPKNTVGKTTASKAIKSTTAAPKGDVEIKSSEAKTTPTQSRTEKSENPTESKTARPSENIKTEKVNTAPQSESGSYKPWAVLVIAVIAVAICIILFAAKKRNKKNFLLILIIAAVAIVVCLATDFQSTESYYGGEENADSVGTVTIEIRCDSVAGKEDYIPKDGAILKPREFEIQEGDTVFDVLLDATAQNKIHMEKSGSGSSVYIEGIHNIYEFQFGDLSGWVYEVNGKDSSLSCSEYELTDGDSIQWNYTLNLK